MRWALKRVIDACKNLGLFFPEIILTQFSMIKHISSLCSIFLVCFPSLEGRIPIPSPINSPLLLSMQKNFWQWMKERFLDALFRIWDKYSKSGYELTKFFFNHKWFLFKLLDGVTALKLKKFCWQCIYYIQDEKRTRNLFLRVLHVSSIECCSNFFRQQTKWVCPPAFVSKLETIYRRDFYVAREKKD